MTNGHRKLRIATYNVHKCEGLDRRVSPGRIAEVIAETNADVIGLQEVLSISGGPPEADQAEYLARALNMNYVMGDVRSLRGGMYGNLVLSRLPVHSHCKFDLSIPGREQRGCVRTDVDLGTANPLHLFNFHLGTAFLERRLQAKLLIESQVIRSPELAGPRVVVGDFNEWTRGLVSKTLAAEFRGADIRLHLKDKWTYPGVFPVLHLDHIYYDEALVVEHVALHRTRKALVASDHLPLLADFVVKESE